MTRRLFLPMVAALALVLAVAACGGDDDDGGAAEATTETTPATTDTEASGGGGGQTLTLTADPSGALAFDTTELTTSAGEVTIELVNDSGTPHNVEVEGNGVEEESETITSGTTDLKLNLEPGEYEFYCAVDGHKDAGMEGTLTVN
jgi:plastocyanin